MLGPNSPQIVVPFEHDTYPRQGDIRYQVVSTSIDQFYASYLDNPGALELHTHIHRAALLLQLLRRSGKPHRYYDLDICRNTILNRL